MCVCVCASESVSQYVCVYMSVYKCHCECFWSVYEACVCMCFYSSILTDDDANDIAGKRIL